MSSLNWHVSNNDGFQVVALRHFDTNIIVSITLKFTLLSFNLAIKFFYFKNYILVNFKSDLFRYDTIWKKIIQGKFRIYTKQINVLQYLF